MGDRRVHHEDPLLADLDGARLCPARLRHKTGPGRRHRDRATVAETAVPGGNRGGLFEHSARGLAFVDAQDNVATGVATDVKPPVVRASEPDAQAVVVSLGATHQNGPSVIELVLVQSRRWRAGFHGEDVGVRRQDAGARSRARFWKSGSVITSRSGARPHA